MDRKVKVRPDQAYRMRQLVYLADGIDQLQLSELRIYKAWKDFFFQCLCEMEELDLLKSIRTYPLGIISEPDDNDSGSGSERECEQALGYEYSDSGAAAQCLNNKEVINMQGSSDRSSVRAAHAMKICPVVHLAVEQTEQMGNQLLSGEQLMNSWMGFFLQVLWELQQEGLIEPICTPKSNDHQTSNIKHQTSNR